MNMKAIRFSTFSAAIANSIFFLSPQTTAFATPERTIHQPQTSTTSTLFSSVSSDETYRAITRKITMELNESVECSSLVMEYLNKPQEEVSVEDVILACDAVDGSGMIGDGENGET